MAQYLPYIPETIPEPALYKPDFNFFDRMLQRKQSMFEQGASRVRSAYTSVLNAPLSNKNNIPLRDQYIKDAQEQLTKISSSDLSLMENVNAAESIYAPFWQDKFIVQDAAITKAYQTEMQKYASWKDSAKPEEREKYNSIGMLYLQNGLSKLQNAERTPEAFGAVEMRKAEPFTNIEAYLDKIASQEKLQVKYDDPNGPYLIETVNGERSKQKYATWAASRIGNNFQGQFDITGTVENEERAKILKRNNPNITDEEVQTIIAKDVVSELTKGYTKRNEEVDVEMARIDSLLSSIGQTGGPQNEQMFNKLIQERAELSARKSSINEEYKYFDQDKSKVLDYVTKAPKQYFSVLAKQRLINNWATGTASIDQKLIKENTGFTAAQNYELNKSKFNLDVMKVQYDREQQLWERANPKVSTTGKDTPLKDANGNVIATGEAPGTDEAKSMVYLGASGTAIERTAASELDIYNKQQTERFVSAHNMLFTQESILGLTKSLGLNNDDISYVATALQKEIATDYAHTFTKEEAAAANKLTEKLLASPAVKEAGITKITGPGTMKNALIAYATDHFITKLESDIPLTQDETSALMYMATASKKLQEYNANEEKRKELIKTNLLGNKALSHLVVDRPNNEKDLVGISDLEKNFKATEFEDEDGNKVTLSAKDLASAYMSGNMSEYKPGFFASIARGQLAASGTITFGKTVTIGGKKYSTQGTLTPNMLSPSEPIMNYPKGLEQLEAAVLSLNKTYKSSGQLAKDITLAHQSIVPNLLVYKDLTGVQSKEWQLVFKANKTMADGDLAAKIVSQSIQPGNIDEVYDANGGVVSEANIKAINTLLKSEKNMEEYVTANYIPDGINGKKTLRITLSKVQSDDGKDTIEGVKISELPTTINYTLKENTGTDIDKLAKSPSFQTYDALLRGQEIKSDAILKAAGFEFALTPNFMGPGANPTFVTVDLKYKTRVNKRDPQTGELRSELEQKSYLSRINLTGDNAKGADEIVATVYDLLFRNMSENQRLQEEYNQYLKSANTSGGSTWNPKEALKAANLSHLIK
jgi:hypothetical protein